MQLRKSDEDLVFLGATTKRVLNRLGLSITSDASSHSHAASTRTLYQGKKDLRPPELQDFPLRARHIHDYVKKTANNTRSAHEVDIVEKNGKRRFLKHNTSDKDPSLVMSQLEAACAGFYQLLIPNHVPSTRPVYNDKLELMEVCSDAIEDFKSIIEDPLTKHDLEIFSLDHELLDINMLEQLDQWAECAGIQLTPDTAITHEHDYSDWVDTVPQKGTMSDGDEDIDAIIYDDEKENCEEIRLKVERCKQWFQHPNMDPKDPNRLLLQDLIKTVSRDLINFRIVKGLALCLVASFLFEEDDLHRKNMSKYGKRIDFDMSLWNRLYSYKYMAGSFLVKFLRSTTSSAYPLSFREPGNRFDTGEDDIKHFPNLRKFDPYYWVTKGQPYFPETIAKMFSENGFISSDHAIFALLENHPVFIYYKYRTFLKYILTDSNMYRDIADLNICKGLNHESGDTFANVLTDDQKKRIQYFEDLLVKMPEFKLFMQQDGDRAFREIREEFAARQNKLKTKAAHNPEYEAFTTDYLSGIDEKFERIKAFAMDGCYVKFAEGQTSETLKTAFNRFNQMS